MHLTLELANGTQIHNPSTVQLAEAIKWLQQHEDGFAILSRSEQSYLQVAGGPEQPFTVEYQAGSLQQHYQASNTNITEDDVIAAFQAYEEGREQWLQAFDWELMKF